MPRAKRGQNIVRLVFIVALVLVLIVAVVWAFQRRLIYFPTEALPDVASVAPGAEQVTFSTQDGLTLSAWLVPASREANGATIVVFSGNAGNRADRLPLAEGLAESGYGVLLVDYRGYGGNPGNPSEEGLLRDGRAAVAYLETRADVDPDRLVYFGESLGAAVAIGVAEQRPPAALVLRSPFTSLTDVASVHYPFLPAALLLWDRYPNLERMSKVNVPTLVVAGSADRTVPSAQSQRLFDAASDPKEFVMIQGADHNDFDLTAGVPLVTAVTVFLEKQH